MTRKMLPMLALAAGFFLTACLPAHSYVDYNGDGTVDSEEKLWRETTVTNSVLDALRKIQQEKQSYSSDCYGALHHFSGSHAKARQIIYRESRNDPTAANSKSTARGCFQLMMSYHAWRFTAVGCTPSDWADAVCNVKAADHLYREVGWDPWNL